MQLQPQSSNPRIALSLPATRIKAVLDRSASVSSDSDFKHAQVRMYPCSSVELGAGLFLEVICSGAPYFKLALFVSGDVILFYPTDKAKTSRIMKLSLSAREELDSELRTLMKAPHPPRTRAA